MGAAMPEYFHIDIAIPGRTASENNLSLEQVLNRIAKPYRLGKSVLVDGYEFPAAQVNRFKIRRTSDKVEPEKLMASMDVSSFANAFASFAKIGTSLQSGEDVTDDLLLQADQKIKESGEEPVPASPVFARIDSKKLFVVTSFAPEFDQNFDAIHRASSAFGIAAVRVDKEISSDAIIDRIQHHLLDAAFVVADLTQARPNVYYEIGYFDALLRARQVRSADHLLLVAKNIEVDAHFDLRHRGIEQYDNPYSLMTKVEEWLEHRGLTRK